MSKQLQILTKLIRDQIKALREADAPVPPQNPGQPNQIPNQQSAAPATPGTPQNQKPDPNIKQGKPEDGGAPRVGYVNIEQAAALIRGTKGKIFTVTFQKKKGEMRVMNARLGVKMYLRGGSLKYDPNAHGLIPVYDIQKRAYRMINIEGIKEIKFGKYTFTVK